MTSNPGFASVKYEAQFGTFSQGATKSFTLVVRNFDPAAPVQVQAKAGRTLGAAQFTLSTASCERTPSTPTPTPPFSPLPPDPSLTLDDYTFSAPRVVMTSPFASLAILDWLPDNRRAIVPLSATAKGGYLGSGSAWSTDGYRLLYRCHLDDMPADLFGVCESTVTIGD